MEHILIIDDDKELCTLMKKCVEKEGWFAMVAHNGLEGLKFLDEYREGCVLIILDVMMPGIDGFQVLQKIRESSNVPVLMLTAKGDEGDKVFGLRLGADDYLTKPFSISELMARVNSLVRRYTTLNQQESHNQDKIVLKGMSINKSKREVIVQNNQIELTGNPHPHCKSARSSRADRGQRAFRCGRQEYPAGCRWKAAPSRCAALVWI